MRTNAKDPLRATRFTGFTFLLALAVLACGHTATCEEKHPPTRSPLDLAYAPQGHHLAVSDPTAGSVVLIDARSGRITREVKLRGRPMGVEWSADGQRLFVAEGAAGTVAEVDIAGVITRRFKVGPRPVGLALASRRGLLCVADAGTHTVSLVSLEEGRETSRLPVGREPHFLEVSPDESLLVVGNRLPAGDASRPTTSTAITLIDLSDTAHSVDVRLPPNSFNLLGLAISSDGRLAYGVHNLGRTTMSTERVVNGWINRNALTLVDLHEKRRYFTLVLDSASEGAANPWGVALAESGKSLWITLSGVHQLGRLDLLSLREAMAEPWPDVPTAVPNPVVRSPADRGASGSAARNFSGRAVDPDAEVVASGLPTVSDLGVLTDGRFYRVDLPGRGPRGVAVSPDGSQVAVALYFSGRVLLIDSGTLQITQDVDIGPQREADAARRGEEIFHDARRCYQYWLSCSTCHPDGRADGLNWDLLNDGSGNAKNTRSLLWSHLTPPSMARGVRPEMEAATAAGFRSLLFRKAPAEDLHDVVAYLKSLEPSPSPYLVAGKLSKKALRGKDLFGQVATGCIRCHPPRLFTDTKMHDVGTRGVFEWEVQFDTPTLREVWRTAPYLHHGKAETLRQVFTQFNAGDRHGKTSHLSSEELDALVEYVRSL